MSLLVNAATRSPTANPDALESLYAGRNPEIYGPLEDLEAEGYEELADEHLRIAAEIGPASLGTLPAE